MVHALGVGLLVLMVLAEITRFVAVFDEADGEHRVASSQLLMARKDVRPAQPSNPALEALHKSNKRLMVSNIPGWVLGDFSNGGFKFETCSTTRSYWLDRVRCRDPQALNLWLKINLRLRGRIDG
jgi:hypothetical protein